MGYKTPGIIYFIISKYKLERILKTIFDENKEHFIS